jgi:hypothetical protein
LNRRLLFVAVIALGICIAALVAASGPYYYRALVISTMLGSGDGGE